MAAAEHGGIAFRQPILFQLFIQPHQRQRAARHVEAGDIFADFRRDDLHIRIRQAFFNGRPEDEEFLIFGGAEPIEQNCRPPCACRSFGQNELHQHVGEFGRADNGAFADAWFAMNAEAKRHLTFRHFEERCFRARQGAAGEGDAHGERAAIGVTRDPFNLIQG